MGANQYTQREMVDMPAEMMILPRDDRGFPVPHFVAWIDGKPDFRVIKPGWIGECRKANRCWLCGGYMGKRKWFVIGPMCAVNRVNSEPPSHRLCAEFAAKNCPFLTRPMAKRNERDLPENVKDAPGLAIARNPGVCCVWETKSYECFEVTGGTLFELGPPETTTFWREGRPATYDEVVDSVKTGIPALADAAIAEGPSAVKALERQVERFQRMLSTVYKRHD